ncbi:MAG TPA: lipid kinase [Candidatus Nanoarchaeia archaeon]|nr:lipid kinase [Candidatus Nanoarchaeia archaeon]
MKQHHIVTRRTFLRGSIIGGMGAMLPLSAAHPQSRRPRVRIAWSIYTGWMPWEFAAARGILKKWSDRCNVDLVLMDQAQYGPTIEAYSAEQADACVMTNMDCMIAPAATGRASTVLIMGDYSNGNDAIILPKGMASIKGEKLTLIGGTVSQYLYSRFLTMTGMAEADVPLEFVLEESDIPLVFVGGKPVATWNPHVMSIMKMPGSTKIFDSSKIPGEIQDLLVVSTPLLEQYPDAGKALVGAWYEVMAIMSTRGEEERRAIAHMAAQSPCSATEFREQLKTTMLYTTSQAAAAYLDSAELRKVTGQVFDFCWDAGLFKDAKTRDFMGIRFPDGSVLGNPKRVFMTFDSKFTEMHARGEIK